MADSSDERAPASRGSVDRREFAASAAMLGGLGAGYGMFFYMAGRFLYPSSGMAKAWVFVAELDTFAQDDSMEFETPVGAKVVIARREVKGTAADFIALSSTCPHLGCQVHWVPQENHFFCPCHNGVFDPEGKAIEGPPADAGQSLPEYPLRVEGELLFIEVPIEGIVGQGHSPVWEA